MKNNLVKMRIILPEMCKKKKKIRYLEQLQKFYLEGKIVFNSGLNEENEYKRIWENIKCQFKLIYIAIFLYQFSVWFPF